MREPETGYPLDPFMEVCQECRSPVEFRVWDTKLRKWVGDCCATERIEFGAPSVRVFLQERISVSTNEAHGKEKKAA